MKQYSKEFLLQLYLTMLRIRICEENLEEPILNKDVRCPVHLCSGEEAVAVGVCAALSKTDYIFGNHRSHGHFIAKGGEISKLVAEIYGKATGCSRGRGGSMHLIDPDKGMLGSAPIVAGTISLSVGAALASKIRRDRRVAVSFFGDGATGEGVLYESLNFAALKRLPMLFICENNLYATHMPIWKCRPNQEIYKVGLPFDITSLNVDGNNVIAVYEAAKKAVDLCRYGDGPVFIECKTYRLRGHVGPDDNIQGAHTDIRPKEELKLWREKKDPIANFEKDLICNNILTREGLSEIRQQVKHEIDDIFALVHEHPYPNAMEITRYVFKN